MAASVTDVFKKVGASTVTTLSAPGKALSATSINVGSTTNYPADTGMVVGIRVVDANGELVAGTYTEWNGVVTSATSIQIEATPVYGTDQVYAAGSTTQVFLNVSASLHNQLVDGILVEHKQDGTHSDITADSITTNASGSVDFSETPLATTDIADGAITAAKRSGGFAIGTIAAATLNSTGNKSVTGLGFTPKLVRFFLVSSASTVSSASGVGGMTASAQFCQGWASDGASGARDGRTNSCIIGINASGTVSLRCTYVSLDADGFTINVAAASPTWDVAYEAYA